MNITQTENDNALITYSTFIKSCGEYKALLTANELPVSVDISLLKTTLKTILFDKLLSVDKGLKMRYEMTKSDTGKIGLINSTINLEGYDIIPDLETRIKALGKMYWQIGFGVAALRNELPMEKFATLHGMDLQKLLLSFVIDWSKNQPVYDLFLNLIPSFQLLHDSFKNAYQTSYQIDHTLTTLLRYYFENYLNNNNIKVDEHRVFEYVQILESKGALAALLKQL